MQFLRRLWTWLTSPPSRNGGKGHPDIYPIDVEKLAKELKLDENAHRLGEAGLPAVDAKDISGPEAAALQRVEKARQDYINWAEMRLGVLREE